MALFLAFLVSISTALYPIHGHSGRISPHVHLMDGGGMPVGGGCIPGG